MMSLGITPIYQEDTYFLTKNPRHLIVWGFVQLTLLSISVAKSHGVARWAG